MSTRLPFLSVLVLLVAWNVSPCRAADSEDPVPTSVTIQDKSIPLSKALMALSKQTGIEVEDRRREKEDRPIKLDLAKSTFWQALDTIAREADLRVSLYERDRKIALVDGPYHEVPTSYTGPFRIAIKRMTAVRDLEADAHFTVAHLEVAWEPRIQAFLLESRPDSLVVKDDKGRVREMPEEAKGQASVNGRLAEVIEVRLPGLPRSANAIAQLKGTLSLVGATKMLTFTFNKLEKETLTQDGVTVRLFQLSTNGDPWTIGLSLRYPPGGPRFESFQSSVVNNEIYLEKNGKRYPSNGGSSIDQTDNEATVRYLFEEDQAKKFILGKPADWKLIYLTPGKISEMPVPFEFKDVPLP